MATRSDTAPVVPAQTAVDLTFWINLAKANAAGKVPVSMRVTVHGGRAEISTGIRCLPEEWDKTRKRLVVPDTGKVPPAVRDHNKALSELEASTLLLGYEVRREAQREGRPFTAAMVRDAVRPPKPAPPPDALQLLRSATLTYTNLFTRETAQTALNALLRYCATPTLPLPCLTPEWCAGFALWWEAQGGGGGYLTTLHALFARAKTGRDNPFPVPDTRQKSKSNKPRYVLSKAELAGLAALTLPKERDAAARDIYLCQYYLHGSRVGVVLELMWEQVNWAGSRVRFKAEKGGDWHDVAIRPALAVVLQRYWRPDATGPVFPFLPADFATRAPAERHRLRKAANVRVWNGLQKAAKLLGLPGRLHSHTARHSLATHTVEATGSFRTAQGLLGHKNLAMTEKYVRSMLPTELDLAADEVYK